MHLRRRPIAAVPTRAFSDQHDHAIALRQNVVDDDPESAIRQFHEAAEESEHLGVTPEIPGDRTPAGNVPQNVSRQRGQDSWDIATRKRIVSALDELPVCLRIWVCCADHARSPSSVVVSLSRRSDAPEFPRVDPRRSTVGRLKPPRRKPSQRRAARSAASDPPATAEASCHRSGADARRYRRI